MHFFLTDRTGSPPADLVSNRLKTCARMEFLMCCKKKKKINKKKKQPFFFFFFTKLEKW